MQHSILHCQNPADFVRTISALESTEQVIEYFGEIVACYGGIHVLIRRFKRPHESLAECVLMDTRPPAWARRHRSKNYADIDPLVLVAQKRAQRLVPGPRQCLSFRRIQSNNKFIRSVSLSA